MALVDNNVLSSLAKIDWLELLPSVFETVEMSPSVIGELDRAEVAGYEFVSRIDEVKSYNDGWLEIVTPTRAELELADDIGDHALSSTDARCLAIASQRGVRLVTDDAHVGTRGQRLGVEIWDLVLLLQAAIHRDVIATTEELSTLVEELGERDGYRFSETDRNSLFATVDKDG
jgi:predicted nucleic acid-binding protein